MSPTTAQPNGHHNPYTFSTDRLVLRLADPNSDQDCERIVATVQDPEAGKGGNNRVGLNCIEDVRYMYEVQGPRAEDCTLVAVPPGKFLLVFLRSARSPEEDDEGDFIGIITMTFRREMPFPDMGWAVLGPFQGQGYATEAGKAALKFWTEVIGVKEVCAMTVDGNERSIRLAEKIGFAKAGRVDIYFGGEGEEEKVLGRGLVLPGMQWRDGLWIRPTVVRPEGWRWEG